MYTSVTVRRRARQTGNGDASVPLRGALAFVYAFSCDMENAKGAEREKKTTLRVCAKRQSIDPLTPSLALLRLNAVVTTHALTTTTTDR